MNVEISKIEDEINSKMYESFQKIKKIKEEKELATNIKIKEELAKADYELMNKKDEFVDKMNLFRGQISSNIDEGILNYSQMLIRKVSSIDVDRDKLTSIFYNIKA